MSKYLNVDKRVGDIFIPPDSRTVWKWAEDEIMLSIRQTETPGPYSSLLTPYVRDPLECFQNPRIRDLALCWGAQTSKTTVLMMGVGWRIINMPAPSIWVLPTENLADSFSEARLQPMIDDCSILKALKPDNKHSWTKKEMHFKNSVLTLVGSNSPANLASRPAGLLIMDEIDKFKLGNEREAGAVLLAENRTRSYSNSFRVKTSTPTTEHGEIWQEFLKGDQRYYHIPCPHCKDMIRLQWAQVRWNETKKEDGSWDFGEVKKSTRYICQTCQGEITDSQKLMALRNGKWIPSNLGADPSRRSYHLSSLYAPWRSCGFGELAVQFLQAKASLNGLQDFVNSTLAEFWNDQGFMDRGALKDSIKDKPDPWPEERYRIMTIDVQETHFWYVVRAWAQSGESYLIEEGKALTFDELSEIQSKNGVRRNLVMIDIAHRSNEVAQECIKRGFKGLWGSERKEFIWPSPIGKISRYYSQEQKKDAFIGTSSQGAHFASYVHWCNDPIKDSLAALRRSKKPGWWVHSNISDAYKWQIDAEVKKERRSPVTGFTQMIWKQSRKDNHLLDCELMQLVPAYMLGLIKSTEE